MGVRRWRGLASHLVFACLAVALATGCRASPEDTHGQDSHAKPADANGATPSNLAPVELQSGPIRVESAALDAGTLLAPAWSAAGAMHVARQNHIAALLSNGQVLVAGGHPGNLTSTVTAETYNPSTNVWTTVGSMATARRSFGACTLSSGKVLVAGGNASLGDVATAELFNPSTNTWSATGSMATAREDFSTTCLADGRVLVAGGSAASGILSSAEVYNPTAGTWSSAGTIPFAVHTQGAVPLTDGRVLIAGGNNASGPISQAAIWNPSTNAWTATASMATKRAWFALNLLADGRVLASAGLVTVGLTTTKTAEIYSPSAGTWSAAASLATARYSGASATVAAGPMVISGVNGGAALTSYELYDAVHNTWSQGTLTYGSVNQTATTLTPTSVLVTGGNTGSNATTSTERYGVCSNAAAHNGTACDSGNKCTTSDSCQSGVCTPGPAVVCTASDTCHTAGTCSPSTGVCSNPVAANGTSCSDGNACTQTDTCQSGTCTGSNPVTCTASDQCHTAGTCNTSTGACSNPAATNGIACNDGNACTQSDTCQAGTCTGANPVTCTASDQCHTAGTCNTSTGACSNPVATNGMVCNDGNACTQSDTCQSGTCTGSNPVTCTVSDQCHTAGTCNTSTGACSNPAATNGTACNDGNACTQTDTCQSGTCTGANPVTCTASDQCHTAGTCNTGTGACSNPAAANGTACNDGNACTRTDACQSGTCTGSPITCTASDQCHATGTCDPSTGVCSNPLAANGTACNDGNACTTNDVCTNGACAGTANGCGTPPQWPVGAVLSAASTGPTSVLLSWPAATSSAGIGEYEVFENGAFLANVDGSKVSYVASALTTGATYAFAVQAQDTTGLTTTNGPTTTYTAQTPNPSVVAPSIDTTVATTVGTMAAFLYSGADPIQTGLTAPIDSQRVTIIQGRVIDSNGNPLQGAAVTVADHPEYGHTSTRADGHYDLVVNGGGTFTLSFDLAGALHAERSRQIPWQDFAHFPDVALIPRDAQASVVDFSGNSGIQVGRASQVQDSDGPRQATLMVAAGTTAQMILPGNQTQDLGTVHVRATEYTVGSNGPAAMPGTLPATSGYTYAVALTIDEAEQANAQQVWFSKPVAFYLENFLQENVGVAMPAGYYDEANHVWVGSTDGRIVKVLSVTGAGATLDVDGSGQAATATAIDALGITSDELTQIAALYAAGQTLWRIPVQHFSAWDFNQGTAPTAGAVTPNAGDPIASPGHSSCPPTATGCIVETSDQVLGERVAVGGTPFSLNYRSNRTTGYSDSNFLKIPLTGPTPPAALTGVSLEVDIAGQQFVQTFGPAPNQQYTYTWDGRDGYGRAVQGSQPVTVRLGYSYPTIHLSPSQESADLSANDQSFGHFTYFGTPAETTPDHRQITLYYEWHGHLGQWTNVVPAGTAAPASDFGGWTLSEHHFYDPQQNILYYGDGRTRLTDTLPLNITTIAGTGNSGTSATAGDNGPAIAADLRCPSSLAVAADGTIYSTDANYNTVRKITPDGVIHPFLSRAPTQIGLQQPFALAIGPSGTIYVADNRVIWTADSSGNLTLLAGQQFPPGGSPGDDVNIDGRVAANIWLGEVWGIAAAPDGSLYIGDSCVSEAGQTCTASTRLLRLSTDGYLRIVVQSPITNSSSQPAPPKGPLSSASFYLTSNSGFGEQGQIAVGPDGSVYLSDVNAFPAWSYLRRIGPDGTFTTVAGDGTTPGYFSSYGYNPALNGIISSPRQMGHGTDGIQATSASVRPSNIAVAPDGSIFFIEADATDDTVPDNQSFIKEILPNGKIKTLAGDADDVTLNNTALTADGSARFSGLNLTPEDGVVVLSDGALLFSECNTHRIRKVRPPVAGSRAGGFTVADDDSRSIFTFDGQGRHLSTADTLTGVVRYRFAYDGFGRLSSVTDVSGNATTIQRDASGNAAAIVGPFGQTTLLSMDPHGFLNRIQDAMGDAYAYAYNSAGLLQTTTTPTGGLYQYTYDANGRLLEDVDPAGGGSTLVNAGTTNGNVVTRTTALGFVNKYELDNLPSGDIQEMLTDPASLVTTVVRGANGTITTTSPDGTTAVLSLTPDSRFGLQSPLAGFVTVQTPNNLKATQANTQSVTLSNPGNLLSVQTLTTTNTINGNKWTTVFSASQGTSTLTSPVGRTATTTIDAQGRPIQIAVPNVAPWSLAYDATGRIATLGQDGNVRTFTYDNSGFLLSVTDALNHTRSYKNDLKGRPTQTTLEDGRFISAGYDADGNTTQISVPGVEAHAFSFTPVDLLASYVPPSVSTASPSTQYTYDIDRKLNTVTRPDGVTVTYGYDSAGRLKSTTVPQGTVTRAYNATTGQLQSSTAASGEAITYSYDGFLKTGETWSGSVPGTLTFSFDSNFRVAQQSVNGKVIGFSFDSDGLLTAAGALSLARDPQNGRLTGTTLGSITDSYGYDSNGLLSSYTATVSGTAQYTESVLRDPVGRITQKSETVQGTTHVWGYTFDAAGRLTDVTKDGSVFSQYGYDADDNRTTYTNASGTVNATYDAQDRLTASGGAAYGYTLNGELASKTVSGQTTNYTYDPLGNLLHVGPPSGSAIDYVVDGENRRVGKKLGGTLSQGFLYQDGLNAVAQLNASGSLVARYVFGSKRNVPDYFTTSAGTFRILSDHLGSPRLVVNSSSGAVVEEIDYDEFGNITNDTSPGLTPFGFAGGLYDKDTGLVRFGARDYDATTGRWTSKDSSRFNGGLNLYGYCNLDPVNCIDRNGRNPAAVISIGGIVIAGGETIGAGLAGVTAIAAIPWALAIDQGIKLWNEANPPISRADDNQESEKPKAAEKPGVCGGTWPGTWPGDDPAEPPAEGWEWRGPDDPGGPRGGWVNPENPGESLHPDLDNEGDGPHWDWNGPGGQRYRIFPDGTVEPK